MALINCPECGVMVSDKAYQCPKCAYPISKDFIEQKSSTNEDNSKVESYKTESVTVNVQQSDMNLNNMLILSNQKSVSAAIILALLFGPFGLFYANSDKALRLLIYSLISFFIIYLITKGDNESFSGFSSVAIIVIWIISLAQASDYVKEYNQSLVENSKSTVKSKVDKIDKVDKLHTFIKEEKNLLFFSPSRKDEILELLNEICLDKEHTINLVEDYNERFSEDILKSLLTLTTNRQSTKEYIAIFEKYDLINY